MYCDECKLSLQSNGKVKVWRSTVKGYKKDYI